MMTKEEKREIDRLVNIWINQILAMEEQSGFRGDSLIARFMAYGCFPPTGNYNEADAGMIIAVDRLRNPHRDYMLIAPVINILWDEKPDYMAAIIAHNFYHGSRLNEATMKPYSIEDRAAIIAQGVETYRYNLAKAYHAIEREMKRFASFLKIHNGHVGSERKKFLEMVDKCSHPEYRLRQGGLPASD